MLCALAAFLITSFSVPFFKKYAARFFMDAPCGVKKHSAPTPLVGGMAVFLGIVCALVLIRFCTNFETGTLHSLRGVLGGALVIFLCGLLDDFKKPKGVSIAFKFFMQAVASALLIYFDVRIKFFDNYALSCALTFLWVSAITNAFNLVDIMDGLCASQAACAAFFFLIIALGGEHIYVNFAAAAVLGSALAFWPYNHAGNKVFLGDSGSSLFGFVLAAMAMGADYTGRNTLGVIAPALILGAVISDTSFVVIARLLGKKNPLKASDDHAVLRLKKAGLSPKNILLLALALSVFFGLCALLAVKL